MGMFHVSNLRLRIGIVLVCCNFDFALALFSVSVVAGCWLLALYLHLGSVCCFGSMPNAR
jgi:hypothetical protein